MWWQVVLLVILGLVSVIAALFLIGAVRWRAGTRRMRAALEATRGPVAPSNYDPAELDGLPAPVQRYFRAVLEAGQPMVAAVDVEHQGSFNMSETGEQWKPFTSNQRVITCQPGFDWDARISVAPGLAARVHDAYIGGEGVLHASLLGLVSLVNIRGSEELAQGELMRFFAEAAWYPTRLLPSQGVVWQAVDDHAALARLEQGPTPLELLFRFGEDGLIASVRAEARARLVDDVAVPTPWECRMSGYELRDGMRVPLEGEVAWELPGGLQPYWRGRITSLRYELCPLSYVR